MTLSTESRPAVSIFPPYLPEPSAECSDIAQSRIKKWKTAAFRSVPLEGQDKMSPLELFDARLDYYKKKIPAAIADEGKDKRYYATRFSLDRITRIMTGLEKGRETLSIRQSKPLREGVAVSVR